MIKSNPIIYSDFPDPDIIRVGDTYYMASTTMHFMPGCDILRSYDLLNWELIGHAYGQFAETAAHKLEGDRNIYGQGMWAPTFRYHKGTFYLIFAANDTKKTYLLRATDPTGPWQQDVIEGFYHDSTLFFDDDDRVFLVYGNSTLYLTELDQDLKGPKKDGLQRIVAVEQGDVILGYEGCHLYKKDGKYYLFAINWPKGETGKRSVTCFVADTLEGDFRGKCILSDDMGFFNQGVAQGGMVDTPDGDWYAFMFQDRGAVGRVPILMPMSFDGEFPVLGENGRVPLEVSVKSTRPDYVYEPLNIDDDFAYAPNEPLKLPWQFNHLPKNDLWSVKNGSLQLTSGKVCPNLSQAWNTLTQRAVGPKSSAVVTVDGNGLKNGDFAGLCALQGSYGAIALAKENDELFVVMMARTEDYEIKMGAVKDASSPQILEKVKLAGTRATLKVTGDFENMKDEARFYVKTDGQWQQVGKAKKLRFGLDHFVGCRYGLFYYSTLATGGMAEFKEFRYQIA